MIMGDSHTLHDFRCRIEKIMNIGIRSINLCDVPVKIQ